MAIYLIAAWLMGALSFIFFAQWTIDKTVAIIVLLASLLGIGMTGVELRNDELSMWLGLIVVTISMFGHGALYVFKGVKWMYLPYAGVMVGTLLVIYLK